MSAEDFFYEHAGYSYDPATQTPNDGRREGAGALADAERWATDHDLTVVWERDPEPYDGDVPYDGPMWVALLVPYDGGVSDVRAAIGGVAIDSEHPDATPYGRVIAAELALQAQGEDS